jgi:hypothetical protein
VLVAGGLAVLLALVLLRVRFLPRDVALSGFALAVAVLGIYALFGVTAALVGGGIIAAVFALGAVIYGVLALAQRWAERQS